LRYSESFVSDKAWSSGHVIDGKYELTEKLGEGGMGSVWRAEHLTLNSPVAVKLLDPNIAQSDDGLSRFLREAQAAAALRSSHVVQTFDYGVADGVPYIVMELLVGESLSTHLAKRGSLTARETSLLLKQVGRAVAKAHTAGIIHRDLKPDNVFLVETDGEEFTAKVLDFGIAKTTTGIGASTTGSKTRTGALLGTPYYMSPEQAQGIKEVDYRSDLWALAVIAFECLTGKRPFDSEALGDLLIRICTAPPPIPSRFGVTLPGFDEWFARAAHRDPEQRFSSATDMARAFAHLVDPSRPSFVDTYRSFAPSVPDSSAVVPPADSLLGTEIPRKNAPVGTKRVLLVTLALVLVAVAVGRGAGLMMNRDDDGDRRTTATTSPKELPLEPEENATAAEPLPAAPTVVPSSAKAESAASSAAPETKPSPSSTSRAPRPSKVPTATSSAAKGAPPQSNSAGFDPLKMRR
jgi:serine/threonine-protein kinase